MRKTQAKIHLARETVRQLTELHLGVVASGRPTGYGTVPCVGAARATTSEAEGAGPCPGEYSWACVP